jgi:hypothetical protein
MSMSSGMRIASLAGGVLAVVPLACAPVAAASVEDQFLDELNTLNITLPDKTPSEVVDAGYAACSDLRSGASVLDEMSAVEQRYHFSQGTLFISAATTNLCPDFAAG